MPTISVIIPAYNAECTILETIVSVQQQTFSDFELIIINDGSTDRTLELLNTVQDPRLKIFSYKNGGVAMARNRGIAHATGEFIAFLDADDLWTPDKLELQLAALQQHPEAGVAYSWTCNMDEQGKSFYPGEPIYFEGDVYANLLVRNFIAHGSNILVRRQAIELVGEFDPALPPCEDWDFYLRLAARFPFVFVPKAQIFYRQSSKSASAKIEGLEKSAITTIEKAFRATPQKLQFLKSQSLAIIYQYCAELYLRYSNDTLGANKARQRLWMAIRVYPKLLLNKEAQDLLKWLIKRWLSVNFYYKNNKQSIRY